MQTTGNSLYVHIPFCTRKCGYCHFFVVRDKQEWHAPYVAALKKEWDSYHLPNLCSVYFGGGTPSLLESSYIDELLQTFSPPASAEITLEANPELLDLAKLKALKKAGVNRLSIGIQSFDDSQLNMLTRTHKAAKAKECLYMAVDAGFENISIDLMFDLPGQTYETWQRSLDIAASLPITHLSLYNLTIEPGTAFARLHKKLPPDDPAYIQIAVETLEKAGLKRYEISAFSKEGFQAVHNTGYWTGRPFIGLGPSAFSYWQGRRFQNVCNYKSYMTRVAGGISPVDFEEKLPRERAIRELFAIHLRLLEGALLPHEIDISALIASGLLEKAGDKVRLTPLGLLHYDTVAAEIV